ncbi:MAG: hypothetical protein SGILL_009734 [Bacillariaceae sp.]
MDDHSPPPKRKEEVGNKDANAAGNKKQKPLLDDESLSSHSEAAKEVTAGKDLPITVRPVYSIGKLRDIMDVAGPGSTSLVLSYPNNLDVSDVHEDHWVAYPGGLFEFRDDEPFQVLAADTMGGTLTFRPSHPCTYLRVENEKGETVKELKAGPELWKAVIKINITDSIFLVTNGTEKVTLRLYSQTFEWKENTYWYFGGQKRTARGLSVEVPQTEEDAQSDVNDGVSMITSQTGHAGSSDSQLLLGRRGGRVAFHWPNPGMRDLENIKIPTKAIVEILRSEDRFVFGPRTDGPFLNHLAMFVVLRIVSRGAASYHPTRNLNKDGWCDLKFLSILEKKKLSLNNNARRSIVVDILLKIGITGGMEIENVLQKGNAIIFAENCRLKKFGSNHHLITFLQGIGLGDWARPHIAGRIGARPTA